MITFSNLLRSLANIIQISYSLYCGLSLYRCYHCYICDTLFIKYPQLTTVERKILFLSLPHLGEIFLQTKTKLTKSLKGLLNCCKLQISFKIERKL